MCGIVGYTGGQPVMPILIEGLRRLEYRGYDSAGVAVHRNKALAVFKAKGKVREVEAKLPAKVRATVGIGHTRWATHGEPSDLNAHPHVDGDQRIALVHNGIVENAKELRVALQSKGVVLQSQTDTELVAHLVAQAFAQQGIDSLFTAVRSALLQVQGAYGVAVLDREHPKEIVVARNGSPVILGLGDREMFIASDVAALVRHTQQVVYLEDGDIARVSPESYEVARLDGLVSIPKTAATVATVLEEFDKTGYEHFTRKEIHEQPDVIERALRGRLDERFATARLDGLNLDAKDLLGIQRIKILGCGSAFIAGSIGARIIERLARIPCDAEPAAEFRYRNPIIEANTLYFVVSQSGETFDTLAAVEEIQRKGGTVLGIVNAVGSSIARACSGGVYLHAGAEVAVVSTKTFAATLTVFVLIALLFARTRDLAHAQGARLISALQALPDQLRELIACEPDYENIAKSFAKYERAYFIGRNEGYGLAMEGALKLKEISYIHAEAYPASELKHGPLALISPQTPTVALVPADDLVQKNLASVAEIRTRLGPVLAITQVPDAFDEKDGVQLLVIPPVHELLTPLLMLIPLQFLAYHAALARECDVDQPRNLAKSVTVE